MAPTTPSATSRDDDFKTYLVDYNCDGAMWSMEIVARSPRDAMARLQRAATFGKVVGELHMKIPAVPGAGLLTRLICWWRNR